MDYQKREKRNGWRVYIPMLLILLIGEAAGGETHMNFQQVNGDGVGTYDDTNPVVLEGVILNVPEEMLDTTWDYVYEPWYMGGQWQMFIQGTGDDHAGTAVYMAQNYGNLGFINDPAKSYTDAAWEEELYRLNYEEEDEYAFMPGDRVRVTGRYMFYHGKTNVSENHKIDPAYDVTIELLEPAYGLPQPELITLDQLKDGGDEFIFDADRLIGCEYYQGCRIRVNNLSWQSDPNQWDMDAQLIVTDGSKTVPVKLGMGKGFYPGSNQLEEPFDVIGILDQEDETSPYTGGYRIWVPNYDGNSRVLADRGFGRGNLWGDVNRDGKVDLVDFAEMSQYWLRVAPGLIEGYVP